MEKDCGYQGEMKLGPWGYHTGEEWSYRPKRPAAIKQIIIRFGGIIDSVVFRGDSDEDCSHKFGGNGGDRTVKIDIDFPSEYLTGISGHYGPFLDYGKNICSLTFHTNRTNYGHFGSREGTAFSVNANGGVITGFHGRYGRYLKFIGIYIMPLCSFSTQVQTGKLSGLIGSSSASGVPSPPRSAAAFGGSGGRDWDDFLIDPTLVSSVASTPHCLWCWCWCWCWCR